MSAFSSYRYHRPFFCPWKGELDIEQTARWSRLDEMSTVDPMKPLIRQLEAESWADIQQFEDGEGTVRCNCELEAKYATAGQGANAGRSFW